MKPSKVLRKWKRDVEAIQTPGSPDNKAFGYLVRANWDIDRAIAFAEEEEALFNITNKTI